MCFHGHPITGDMTSFIALLKNDGYVPIKKRYKFRGMKSKTLKGTFWEFPDCHVIVRQPSDYSDVTSVYIHPLNNYVLLADLLDSYDAKYGEHEIFYSRVNANAVTYTWNLHEGMIQVIASTIYGQSFDIIYRDFTEVNMIDSFYGTLDKEL